MYRRTKLIFFLLLGIGSGLSAVAQNHTLRGRVLDPVGEQPIEGAVVTISSTGQAVKTNTTGEFSVSVPSLTGDITTWYPGFYTDLRPVAGQQELRIVLIPLSKKNYSSTVILPFRGIVSNQAKASSLQAVAKKDVSLPTTSADRSMSVLPGVQVIGKSGMPGEGN
ncbi:MAG: carboxypeptidase-like regulatory domain-containing protein [Bacteroidales bacterium]|nr:carboxypeptidase-like regulatory domain-containing protein [Bacteroidales bacterium]